jgi:hypothetical protein
MKRWMVLLLPHTLWDAVAMIVVVLIMVVIVALTTLTTTWCPR